MTMIRPRSASSHMTRRRRSSRSMMTPVKGSISMAGMVCKTANVPRAIFGVRGLQDVPGDRGRVHPAAQHGDHVGREDKTQRALAEDGTHRSTLAEVLWKLAKTMNHEEHEVAQGKSTQDIGTFVKPDILCGRCFASGVPKVISALACGAHSALGFACCWKYEVLIHAHTGGGL